MTSDIELWGGVECTVNRVGDTFFDQIERTGHAARGEDTDRIAALGVRAVRYPILWERTAQSTLADFDFSWADARMKRWRELGIRVIVGLVHHGSGPAGTSLLDESFVDGLSRFARAVAQRYPWVEDYTPVNEPLTTARFSALYGHWYPHARDPVAFVRSILIQTRATVGAMRAIRTVSPHARLLQTEDFGSTFSTPKLNYQAEFENHRKWLSLDLLFGKVTPHHPLFDYLLGQAASPRILAELVDRPCAPDRLGVNYYVTSDRYLDERVSAYPTSAKGTNGKHVYVDVEAVRVRDEGIVGHERVLFSAWNRYATPLALTEVHLACSVDEQLLWLTEAWRAARAARSGGVDVSAVTLWSLFGAYDWDSLVTQRNDHYEPGAFDVRGGTPRATELANWLPELTRHVDNRRDDSLGGPGWWRRPQRLSRTGSPELSA